MEITMTITVTAKQAEAIAQLLQDAATAENAIQQMRGSASVQQPTVAPTQNTAPVQPAPVQQPVAPQFSAPTQQYGAPVQQCAPPAQNTAPVQPQPAAPTAAPAYTIAQLQTACAPLMDAGKGPQLQQLVQSFGVATLMDIPQSRYGEFANGLRQLGGVL